MAQPMYPGFNIFSFTPMTLVITKTKDVEKHTLLHGNGCHYHADCFTCPFPPDKCKYGNGGSHGK